MPTIAVVDDRKNDRETIVRVVRSTLKKLKESETWGVVSEEPPAKERDVFQWLDENDATVLLTDWKLNEGAKGTRVVNYEADRLIEEIRTRRPNFPIFVVTGFEREANVYLKDVEGVLSRKDFTKQAAVVVPQMLRAGLRRHEQQRELLGRMDVLSRRVATGKGTTKDREALSSLHGYFQSDVPPILDLDAVYGELESVKRRAESLRNKVQARVTEKESAGAPKRRRKKSPGEEK